MPPAACHGLTALVFVAQLEGDQSLKKLAELSGFQGTYE
jgi:hypothetical protein